jgi:AraC-like DNA-binding protein
MAWICAGTRHRVEALQRVELRTVYLGKKQTLWPDFDCRVFPAAPLAREMILGAMRWDEGRDPKDPLARVFFAALGGLALEWARHPGPYLLPTPQSDGLLRATRWLQAHLGEEPELEQVARAAGLSGRTLARRFRGELRMSFREYLRAVRMLRAVELLAQPTLRITEIALEVGFSSPSAFTAAFHAFHGEPPRSYRLVARP